MTRDEIRSEASVLAGEIIRHRTTWGVRAPYRLLPESMMPALIRRTRAVLLAEGYRLRVKRETPRNAVRTWPDPDVLYRFWAVAADGSDNHTKEMP